MEIKYAAFTLVELIVVVTILAILGTIGFISLEGYTKYARDAVRVSDMRNISSAMEREISVDGKYPLPDEGVEILFNNSTLIWTQGIFGEKLQKNTKGLSSVPLDPLTKNSYTVSVGDTRKEMEVSGAYEGDQVVPYNTAFMQNSYAAGEGMTTKMFGRYNGKLKSITDNGVDYILALPSITAIDLSDTSVENIVNGGKLTYGGYNSLPHSYQNPIPPAEGSFDFFPKKLVAWSGSLQEIETTGEGYSELLAGIYSAYLGTNLYLQGDEFKFIDGPDTIKYIFNNHISPIENGLYKNCDEIQEENGSTQNGCYSVKGEFISSDISCLETASLSAYYCNMEKDGGGRTLYTKIKGNYTFEDAKSCILGTQINNSELYCRVPFTFGKSEELWYQDILLDTSYVNPIDDTFTEGYTSRTSFYKSTYFDIMYTGSSATTYSHSRFGFTFNNLVSYPDGSNCGNGRHPGGIHLANRYMNYNSGNCTGPDPSDFEFNRSSRDANTRLGEFYVR